MNLHTFIAERLAEEDKSDRKAEAFRLMFRFSNEWDLQTQLDPEKKPGAHTLAMVMRIIAWSYRDHPDYNKKWRPLRYTFPNTGGSATERNA